MGKPLTLEVVCDLSAASSIDQDHGSFLAQGLVSSSTSSSVHTTVDRLSERLAADGLAIVDGFAIAGELLVLIAKR